MFLIPLTQGTEAEEKEGGGRKEECSAQDMLGFNKKQVIYYSKGWFNAKRTNFKINIFEKEI